MKESQFKMAQMIGALVCCLSIFVPFLNTANYVWGKQNIYASYSLFSLMTSFPNAYMSFVLSAILFSTGALLTLISKWGKYLVGIAFLGFIISLGPYTMFVPNSAGGFDQFTAHFDIGFLIAMIGTFLVLSRIIARCVYAFVTTKKLVIVNDMTDINLESLPAN